METLAEKDLALVGALQVAPRISWVDAAGILEAHPTVLAGRWEWLRKHGIAWVTAQFSGHARQQVLAFSELSYQLDRRAAVTDALLRLPQVMSVDVFSQNHGLGLTSVEASMSGMVSEVFRPISALPGVLGMHSSICVTMHSSAQKWRLHALDRPQLEALQSVHRSQMTTDPSVRLGPEHEPIIAMLQRDGRATAADVARNTGQSPATARRHLAKVLSSDLLTLRCDMAQALSGFPITVQWFSRLPAADHVGAAQKLAGTLNMRMIASTTGKANFLLTMWLSSVNDIINAERAIAAQVPAVEFLESAVMMEPLKRNGWLIAPDSTTTGLLIAPPISLE